MVGCAVQSIQPRVLIRGTIMQSLRSVGETLVGDIRGANIRIQYQTSTALFIRCALQARVYYAAVFFAWLPIAMTA